MTKSMLLSEEAAHKKLRIRCELCRQKYPDTHAGRLNLQGHRGHSLCRQRQRENEGRKQLTSKKPTTVPDVNIVAAPAISHSFDLDLSQLKQYVNPPVHSANGCWTRECDRCGARVGLGKVIHGGHFEVHQNSGACLRKAQFLKASTAAKQSENESSQISKGIKKYFSSSQSSSMASSSQNSEKTKFEQSSILLVPTVNESSQASKTKAYFGSSQSSNLASSSQGPQKMESEPSSTPVVFMADVTSKPVKAKGKLTPADANLMTLARDVNRALAEFPAGKKRKSSKDNGRAKKKSKPV
ncbi:hypothetical protein K439DRAFT_1656986 [Ramaria rubella]|nr:hypothetical protein K439DRAFT_1656986 [Ramaria rubella]